MKANAGEYSKNYLRLKGFPCISLHYKLVPVQYWEYEYGLHYFGSLRCRPVQILFQLFWFRQGTWHIIEYVFKFSMKWHKSAAVYSIRLDEQVVKESKIEAQIWILQGKVETYAFTQGNKFQPRNYYKCTSSCTQRELKHSDIDGTQFLHSNKLNSVMTLASS